MYLLFSPHFDYLEIFLFLLKYLAKMMVSIEQLTTIDIKVKIDSVYYRFPAQVWYINEAYEIYKVEGKSSTLIILSDRPFIANHSALKHRKPKCYIINRVTIPEDVISIITQEIITVLNRVKPKFRSYDDS